MGTMDMESRSALPHRLAGSPFHRGADVQDLTGFRPIQSRDCSSAEADTGWYRQDKVEMSFTKESGRDQEARERLHTSNINQPSVRLIQWKSTLNLRRKSKPGMEQCEPQAQVSGWRNS
jgi:hypothetical protein